MADLTRLKAICEVDSKSAEAGLSRLHGGLGNLTAAMGVATGALAALGIGIAGAFALKSAIDKTEQLGEQVFRMTKIFGLTAESASKWLYVAQATGVSAESLQKSFKILSKNLETVQLKLDTTHKLGLSPFNEEMKRLGVRLEDNHGHLRDFQSILLDTADAFVKLGPAADLAGHATIVFGKGGVDLIPILQLGKQGIIDLENEAQKYGLVITSDNLPKIHAYIEAHRHLDAAMQGMQLTIGTALIPVLTALSERVTGAFQAIRGWINANPGVITSLQKLGEAGIGFVSRAIDGLLLVISGPQGAKKNLDDLGGKAQLAALATGGSGPDSLASSITTMANKLSDFMNSKSTANFLHFWDDVSSKISTVVGWLQTANSLLDANSQAQAGFIKAHPHGLLGDIANAISPAGSSINAGIGVIQKALGVRAGGGPVSAYGDYVVGERGPELLHMGSQGGTIIPNGGGRGITINLYATVADGPALDRFTNEIAQRLSYVTGR